MSAPRSERFEDVYFSQENGMEETQHVFLDGNNVPVCWEGRDRFVVCETGFGTGLNILMAFAQFNQLAKNGQNIDFISFEAYPLSVCEIQKAHENWAENFSEELAILLENYPVCTSRFHRIQLNAYVTLTLVFEDVNTGMKKLDANVDCWFLDGFRPATNPEMWTDEVFSQMARLSNPGASFATFTAAGFVKRGLQAAGFDVKKVPGYGRKREMLTGKYIGKDKIEGKI